MENLNVKQLKKLAKERSIKGYYKMKRAELIEVLSSSDAGNDLVDLGDLIDLGQNDLIDLSSPKQSDTVKEDTKASYSIIQKSYFEELIFALTKITNDRGEKTSTIRCSESNIISYNGWSRCPHGKDKPLCKECGGWRICPHGKFKPYCKECGGSQICPHRRVKHQCKDCKGSRICPHNRVIYSCKDCRGCPHNRLKRFCRDCKGSSICEHNRVKYTCKECGGKGICIHKKNKRYCKDCKGNGICPHGIDKSYCKECGRSQICTHMKYKGKCEECKA